MAYVESVSVAPLGDVTVEEQERGALLGYYNQVACGVVKSLPLLRRFDAQRIKECAAESHEEKLDRLLSYVPNSNWREHFRSRNKLVIPEGASAPVVVPRVPGLDAKPLAEYREADVLKVLGNASDLRMGKKKQRGSRKPESDVRRFVLGQVLADVHAQRAYALTPGEVQVFARRSVIRPDAAAEELGKLMSERGGVKCIVSVGEYASGPAAARRCLVNAAEEMGVASFQLDMATVGATHVIVDGLRSGYGAWSVQGPVWSTQEVVAVARMLTVMDVFTLNTFYGMQLTKLGLIVADESPTNRLVGSEQFCAGYLDSGIGGSGLASCGDGMVQAGARLAAVRDAGRVVATSVLLARDVGLLNAHVLEQFPGAEVGLEFAAGKPKLMQSAGADLWAVQIECRGDASVVPESVWDMRPPEVGEQARVVYFGGAGLECSDPVPVVRVSAVTLLTSGFPQVRRGLSGGALVAESDGALLGVLRSYTDHHVVFSRVSPESAGPPELSMAVSVAASDEVTPANRLYSQFDQRGLSSAVIAAARSMVPLYVGSEHVAMGAIHAGKLHSVLTPELWPLSAERGGPPLHMRDSGSGVYRAAVPVGHYVAPVIPRRPVASEAVCLVWQQGSQVYFSEQLTVYAVSRTRRFVLSHVPSKRMPGALVLAVSDAAVLGQYSGEQRVPHQDDPVGECVSILSRTMTSVAAVGNAIRERFSFLEPEAWGERSLERVSSLDVDEIRRMECVGRLAFSQAYVQRGVRAGDSAGQLETKMARLGDAVWVSRVAAHHRLHELMLATTAASRYVQPAVLLYALFGLVATYESAAAVSELVECLCADDALSDLQASASPTPVSAGLPPPSVYRGGSECAEGYGDDGSGASESVGSPEVPGAGGGRFSFLG